MNQKDKKKFRDSASFGKRQEFIVISKLLRKGYDVYQTLVDDQQIDCIIRKGKQSPLYADIQIKARSKDCSPKDAARFAGLVIENPRPNYFFIFYSQQLKKTWIIPSMDITNREAGRIGSKNEKGINAGKYSINMAGYGRTDDKARADGPTTKRFQKYEEKNGYDLLDKMLSSAK
ncbi:MAG: hypothetical protein ABSB89_08750 [Candidatus Bathyarchaeia archaeon]